MGKLAGAFEGASAQTVPCIGSMRALARSSPSCCMGLPSDRSHSQPLQVGRLVSMIVRSPVRVRVGGGLCLQHAPPPAAMYPCQRQQDARERLPLADNQITCLPVRLKFRFEGV
jgi:hypothetical protein